MMEQLRYDLSLICTPMTEQDGIAICSWTYDPPYDIYNWPSWAQLVEEQREFADEAIRTQQYFSIKNDEGTLVAFTQFFSFSDTIRLGLFVHPDLLNQGLSKQIGQLVIHTIRSRFSQPFIDLEVAKWNTRAIHVYKKLNFQIEDEYELYNGRLQKSETVYNMVFKHR